MSTIDKIRFMFFSFRSLTTLNLRAKGDIFVITCIIETDSNFLTVRSIRISTVIFIQPYIDLPRIAGKQGKRQHTQFRMRIIKSNELFSIIVPYRFYIIFRIYYFFDIKSI